MNLSARILENDIPMSNVPWKDHPSEKQTALFLRLVYKKEKKTFLKRYFSSWDACGMLFI